MIERDSSAQGPRREGTAQTEQLTGGVPEGRVSPSTEKRNAGLVQLCAQTVTHSEGLHLPVTPDHGGFPWQHRCATKILYKVELMLEVLREGGNAVKPKTSAAFHFLPPFDLFSF